MRSCSCSTVHAVLQFIPRAVRTLIGSFAWVARVACIGYTSEMHQNVGSSGFLVRDLMTYIADRVSGRGESVDLPSSEAYTPRQIRFCRAYHRTRRIFYTTRRLTVQAGCRAAPLVSLLPLSIPLKPERLHAYVVHTPCTACRGQPKRSTSLETWKPGRKRDTQARWAASSRVVDNVPPARPFLSCCDS